MKSKVFVALLAACVAAPAGRLSAQDPFEIHVYEYEPLHWGQYSVEAHLNYVGRGTKAFEGPLAPANNQVHMTWEVRAGIIDSFSLGMMQLSGVRPGGPGLEYAGWRLLPHFYAPRSWRLPVKLGLIAEFSFQRAVYEENSRRVELRPVIEKSIGRWQIDLNPVFERALHGPGAGGGWIFQPALRVAYEASERFTPSLEYYSSAGPVPDFLPVEEQFHQFLPGVDVKLSDNVLWSVGVGIGATPAGNRLVYKSRFEMVFGHKTK